ncbi:MAG: MXAN_6640 family putative metalloprotease, partial [Minicystis sp.]
LGLPAMSRRPLAGSIGLLALGLLGLTGCGETPIPGPHDAPGLAPLVRPDTPGNNLLFRFQPGDMVDSYGSPGGRFLVHYTSAGPNAVPVLDADASGVPDFVEQVGAVYEDVLTLYHDDLAFRAPLGDLAIADNGGDGRFDVYLVDFAGKGDGNFQSDVCTPGNPDACAGYMVQENDYKGYGYPSTLVANRILASHEFFHAVQAAYDSKQGNVFAEGSAVWATETFDPSLDDFEAFLPGYLDNPDRSLDVPLPGPTDPFSYGAALFFEFLEEHYGKGTVRDLWERSANGAKGVANPVWFEQIGPLLQVKANSSFAEAFTDFATWNLFTGKFADPTRSYQNGSGYGKVKIEAVTAPYMDDKLRVFHASSQYYGMSPLGRKTMTAALVSADPAALKGVSLLLAVQRVTSYDPVLKLDDLAAGTQTIDTHGANRLVAVVINGLQTGESQRPGLCVGSVEEVAACKAMILGGGTGGSGGAGGVGGGSTTGATTSGGEGGSGGSGALPADGSGCGCRASSSSPEGSALALVGLGALAAQRRVRRRNRTRATAPA